MKNAVKRLDKKFRDSIKDFILLGNVNWPDEVKYEFLKNGQSGNLKLPKFDYPKHDFTDRKEALRDLISELSNYDRPSCKILKENANSYLLATKMLENLGTNSVTEISSELYGTPYDIIPGFSHNSLHAAKYFVKTASKFKSEEFLDIINVKQTDAEGLKKYLKTNLKTVFGSRKIKIDIVPDMASKASVTISGVKIRESAVFNSYEMRQLLNHEVFTHALTSINGSKQTYLKSLAYTAPRITATQEGLAQFAELITGSIHLSRLKRIALRIVAIDMVNNGADFIELFKFFKDGGSEDEEAYLSAMRIMRGGKPEGGIIFHKDGVYIKGMLEVFGYFVKSMKENTLENTRVIFSGKMTTGDIETINQIADNNYLEMPKYIPAWWENIHNLAANLAFMEFVTNFDYEEMD